MTSPNTGSDVPNYAAILWDNDGVLVDTERWYFDATRAVFAEAGVDLTPGIYSEYFLTHSGGTSRLAAERGLNESDIATLIDIRNARYLHALEHEDITIEGVRDTLAALQPHFTMGVVTSARLSHFEAIHRRSGLLEFFDFAVTHEDYARSKPAPDPYIAAVARTGFPAARCLAIEDAPRGLAAARAAGIDCWVIRTGLTRGVPFPGAGRVLNSITDAASLLLGGTSPAGSPSGPS